MGRKSVRENQTNCCDQVDFCPFRGPDAPFALRVILSRARGSSSTIEAPGKVHLLLLLLHLLRRRRRRRLWLLLRFLNQHRPVFRHRQPLIHFGSNFGSHHSHRH
jgi:hypothetical protein